MSEEACQERGRVCALIAIVEPAQHVIHNDFAGWIEVFEIVGSSLPHLVQVLLKLLVVQEPLIEVHAPGEMGIAAEAGRRIPPSLQMLCQHLEVAGHTGAFAG